MEVFGPGEARGPGDGGIALHAAIDCRRTRKVFVASGRTSPARSSPGPAGRRGGHHGRAADLAAGRRTARRAGRAAARRRSGLRPAHGAPRRRALAAAVVAPDAASRHRVPRGGAPASRRRPRGRSGRAGGPAPCGSGSVGCAAVSPGRVVLGVLGVGRRRSRYPASLVARTRCGRRPAVAAAPRWPRLDPGGGRRRGSARCRRSRRSRCAGAALHPGHHGHRTAAVAAVAGDGRLRRARRRRVVFQTARPAGRAAAVRVADAGPGRPGHPARRCGSSPR